MTSLHASSTFVHRQQNSYMDPHGHVVRTPDGMCRVLSESSRDFYQSLVDHSVIRRLQADGQLVATAHGDLLGELRHPLITPITYATEWTPSALRDAGLLTLAIAGALASDGLALQDATPFNILFAYARPVFVDFTSIVPEDPHILWKAQSQFDAFFSRPLILASQGKGDAARHALSNPVSGLTDGQFQSLVSRAYRLMHPQEELARWISEWIQSNPARRKRFITAMREGKTTIAPGLRKRFFRKLADRIGALRFPRSADGWKDYYAEIPTWVNRQQKLTQIETILQSVRPASVLDIGANTGVFSMLAAKIAPSVIAAEASQTCTEGIYAAARDKRLPVFPLCCNLVSPPQPAGMLAGDYPHFWERVRSSMTLCLGLMHHLNITGRQPFGRIAQMLDAVTQDTLVFEYIAPTDANVERLDVLQTPDYSLSAVQGALGVYFNHIETLESDRDTRKLLVCTR